jgi:hypothetical protein
MKIFSSLLFVSALTLLMGSCKKETTNPTPAQTNTDHLTTSAWKHESSGVDTDKDGSINVPLATLGVTLPACRLDNLLTFKKDNTAMADEGATKCNDSDPQSTNFNWSFADNEKSLNISGNVFPELNGKFNIKTLTNTTLTLSKDTTVPILGNVALVVNLKH